MHEVTHRGTDPPHLSECWQDRSVHRLSRTWTVLMWLTILGGLGLAALDCPGAVRAEDRVVAELADRRSYNAPTNERAALLLVRLAIGEHGFADRDTSTAAIWHVVRKRIPILRRWGGMPGATLEDAIIRYSAGRVLKSPARPWVAEVGLQGSRPPSLPAWRWDRVRGRVEELERLARRFLDGELPDPCPRAVHWGSARHPVDLARARRAGWERVCPSMRGVALWR